MKLNKILTGLFLIIFFSASLLAQNEKCNFTKRMPVKEGTTLILSNKYGDINFLTVEDDSVTVCVTITIDQDDEILQRKNLKLVNISIEKLKDTIKIATQYDKNFFSESSRVGRKSFNVDYLIKLPAYLDVSVVNEFGNISIEELSGSVNLRLSQGFLSARKLTRGNEKPISSIYIDHGKLSIDELNWMTMTVYNCSSVNIWNAQALMIKSSISKIKTGDISSIVIDSKSDSYYIKSVNNLILESTYSAIEIGMLTGQLRSKTTYGSINISDLRKEFDNIDILSDQTQILLKTRTNTTFISDIVATDSYVEFPSGKYPGILKTESNNSATLRGTAGPATQTKSVIKIRATGGRLTIQ